MGKFPDEEYKGNDAYEILYYVFDGTKKDLDPSFDYYQRITREQFKNASRAIREIGTRLTYFEKIDPSNCYFFVNGDNLSFNENDEQIHITTEFEPLSDHINDLTKLVGLPAPMRKYRFSNN